QRVHLVRVEATAEDEAWRWLVRRNKWEYSFVDATSFAVMRQLRAREALAFEADPKRRQGPLHRARRTGFAAGPGSSRRRAQRNLAGS
ncbi:MAG: hypothetical protein ACRDRT_03810, partial [Pseudonocardiaceae bacterium]